MSKRWPLLFFAVPLFFPQERARAAILDFEDLSSGDLLTTQYPGLIFSNGVALTAGVSVNEFEFPPRSGVNVISDDGGPISITFASPVLSFGGYFTYLVPLTLTAFDAGSNEVSQTVSLFNNNLACLGGPPCSGDVGSIPNELLQVAFAGGISSVVIRGDPAGGSFTLDDATIDVTAVPEPSTSLLFLIGAAVAIATRKTVT